MKNEHGRDDHEKFHNSQQPNMLNDSYLGDRISQVLHQQAEYIQYTPELRNRTLCQLSRHRQQPHKYLTVAAAIIVLTLASILFLNQFRPYQTTTTTIQYTTARVVAVAPELANNGKLLSLDPTEQHIIYRPANQNGVLYIANVKNPAQSNALAMRDARDIAWAPDGSALVATVAPPDTVLPLLALVPAGQYMHLIGPNALAVSWSPSNTKEITYALQTGDQTQIWSITPSGQTETMLMTMSIPLLVKHMFWSQNGHHLALVVNNTDSLTKQNLVQSGHSIYIVTPNTGKLSQLVAPGDFTLGRVSWSPDGHYLTYAQNNNQGKTILQTINVDKPQDHFSIMPQHQLRGWSWSPDSRALVYSDGGMLQTHILHGAKISFPQTNSQMVYPFWLKNGHILCMQITNSKGELALLAIQHK